MEANEEKYSVLKVFCGNYMSLCMFLNSLNHMQKSNLVDVNFKEMNMFLKDYSNRKEFTSLADYKPDS